MTFSIITPVYNCSNQVREYLESLSKQTYKDFEVIIVEDGDKDRSDKVVQSFSDKLNIKYFYKENTGVSFRRNYGITHCSGDYFIFFDSDCIIPNHYMELINNELSNDFVHAYGGPDKAHQSFSTMQKAVSYSMTSFFTTGGIRGGEKKIDKFYPRSFNMGFSKKVFETTNGFPEIAMNPGEDMILSIEIVKKGFKTKLIRDAFVFHKRKTNLKKYFRQIYKFGFVRYPISLLYPETFKIFFIFPALFVFGNIILILLAIFVHYLFLIPILLYIFTVFIDSFIKNKNLKIALLSVITSFIQLFGYGLGFFIALCKRIMSGKEKFLYKAKNFHD